MRTHSKMIEHVDVLHVIGAFTAGGAEMFVVNLVIELNAIGISAGLLVLSARTDVAGEQMIRRLEDSHIHFISGPTERVGARSALWYLNQIQSCQPSIVHLHTPNTEIAHYIYRILYNHKHVICRTVHSTNAPPGRLHWIAIHGNPAALSIACSESVRVEFESRIAGRMTTICNGVKFDWPIRNRSDVVDYRLKLGISNDVYHFASVGRMSGNTLESSPKAHDVLINAWRQSGLSEKGCVLNLLGDGNLRHQLEELACGDPNIIFHGVQTNIHDWLIASDCFVMPSRHEGLPIAGIEAVGTGITCIFTDIPPLRELNAQQVKWVDVNSVSQLSEALQMMYLNQPQTNESLVTEFRNKFAIASTAKAYRNIYRTLTNLSTTDPDAA